MTRRSYSIPLTLCFNFVLLAACGAKSSPSGSSQAVGRTSQALTSELALYDDFEAALSTQKWTVLSGAPSTSGGRLVSNSQATSAGSSGLQSAEIFDGRSVWAHDLKEAPGSGRCWILGYFDPALRNGVAIRRDLNSTWVSANVQDHLFLHVWSDGKNTLFRDLGAYGSSSPGLDFIGTWSGTNLAIDVRAGGVSLIPENLVNVDTTPFMLGMRFGLINYCGSNVSFTALDASPPSTVPLFPEQATVAWQTFDDFDQPLSSRWTKHGATSSSGGRLILDATAPSSNADLQPVESFERRSVRVTGIQEAPGSGRCWGLGYSDLQHSGVTITRALNSTEVSGSIEQDLFLEVDDHGAVLARRDLGSFGPGHTLDFTGVWVGSTLKVQVTRDGLPLRVETIPNAPPGMTLLFNDYCGAKLSIDKVEAPVLPGSPADCAGRPDGSACEDGNLCTTNDRCTAGVCGGKAVICPAGNGCLSFACKASSGDCEPTPAPAQTACSDGDSCTEGDTCDGNGQCLGGSRRACSDGTACSAVVGCPADCRPEAPGGVCTTVGASATSVIAGERITATWEGLSQPSRDDAIGLFALTAPDDAPTAIEPTGGTASGTRPFLVFRDTPTGDYQFRILRHGGQPRVSASPPFTVGPKICDPALRTNCGATVTMTPARVLPGAVVTVTWAGADGSNSGDTIGLARRGGNQYLALRPTGGPAAGAIDITVPADASPGDYTLRLLAAQSLTVKGSSKPLTVNANPCAGLGEFFCALNPPPPASLRAEALSGSDVALTWPDDLLGGGGFGVERWDGSHFVSVGTTGPEKRRFEDSGLSSGVTYTYRVRRLGGLGASDYVQTSITLSRPRAPGSVAVVPIAGGRMRLSWTDTANSESGFQVERSLDGTVWTPIVLLSGWIGPDARSLTDAALAPNTRYYYRLRSYNGIGYSQFTPIVSAWSTADPDTSLFAFTAQASEPPGLFDTIKSISDKAGEAVSVYSNVKNAIVMLDTIIALFSGVSEPTERDLITQLGLDLDALGVSLDWKITAIERADRMGVMVQAAFDAEDFARRREPLPIGGGGAAFESGVVVNQASDSLFFLRLFEERATDTDGWKEFVYTNPANRPALFNDGGKMQVYDWRYAFPEVMRLISLRLGVLTAADPDWRTNGRFSDQLLAYRRTLWDNEVKIVQGIKCATADHELYAIDRLDSFPDSDFKRRSYAVCADVHSGISSRSFFYCEDNISPQDYVRWGDCDLPPLAEASMHGTVLGTLEAQVLGQATRMICDLDAYIDGRDPPPSGSLDWLTCGLGER
jgi:hypothetical protein